jgi:hypothetical protein
MKDRIIIVDDGRYGRAIALALAAELAKIAVIERAERDIDFGINNLEPWPEIETQPVQESQFEHRQKWLDSIRKRKTRRG